MTLAVTTDVYKAFKTHSHTIHATFNRRLRDVFGVAGRSTCSFLPIVSSSSGAQTRAMHQHTHGGFRVIFFATLWKLINYFSNSRCSKIFNLVSRLSHSLQYMNLWIIHPYAMFFIFSFILGFPYLTRLLFHITNAYSRTIIYIIIQHMCMLLRLIYSAFVTSRHAW